VCWEIDSLARNVYLDHALYVLAWTSICAHETNA